MGIKRLLLVIAFIFMVTPVYAQQSYDEALSNPVFVQEFSGGLTSHVNNVSVKNNSANDVVNARFNKKMGSIDKRNEMRKYGEILETRITGMHRYYKSNGDKRLIVTGGDSIYIGDDDSGMFIEAMSGLSDGDRFTFQTYQDIAICMNGIDGPFKFDGNINTGTDIGDRSNGYLFADLGACFADLSESGNLSASGWYQYRVVFEDEDGLNYYTTSRSNAIQVGDTNKSIDLSDIPIGREGTTSRRVYRTHGNDTAEDVESDSSFYLVTTISDNYTTTYNDSAADLSLGSILTIDGFIDVTPPKGKYCEVHAERLFVGGNSTYKSDLYYSDEFNPDYFLPTSFVQIRPDDGDEITFIDAVWGILAIGKRNSIQKFYTVGSESNWYVSGTYSVDGCAAPYSEVNTAIGLIYLGRHGLYRFDGQASYLISDQVTDKIRDISQADIEECFGIYWNNEYHLAYTSQESGEAQNNRVLVYDLIRKNYTLDFKNVNCMTTLESGLDYGLLYFGSSIDGSVLSDGATVTMLVKKYKSDLDEGTYDDTRSFGTEILPDIRLAWDVTAASVNLTNGYPVAADMDNTDPDTWLGARPSTYGEWTSPAYNIKAKSLEKIYWNEIIDVDTDVTARIRTALTESGLSTATWSANFTDPNGSDISGVSASDYAQLSFSLSTSDITKTSRLYQDDQFVFRMTYDKTGVSGESDTDMLWESGWRYLGKPSGRIQIKRIRVFYSGTEGTVNIRYLNDDGQVDGNFDIDLSQSESTIEYQGDDFYRITDDLNSFTHYPNAAFGDVWKFIISDDNAEQYRIDRIEVVTWTDEYTDF